jgi:hypothetical protein
MYETHDDDTGHVLARYPTVAEALADTERLADTVADQLAANGEGHRDYFWVRLLILHAETGEFVAASSYGLPPTPPRHR